MTTEPSLPTRRTFLKNGVKTVLASALPSAFAQSPDTTKPWEAYPFTEIDRSGWPALRQDEKDILAITLIGNEPKALMEHKVNKSVLENKEVLRNMKDKHGFNTGYLPIHTAKWVIMPGFYSNLMKEFGGNDPWSSSDTSVKNVGEHFWKRLSAHAQVDEIQLQCQTQQGKSPGLLLRQSNWIYLKVFGPVESWRGNVPFDPAHLDFHNDKLMENIARRRPILNFPKVIKDLEIPEELLKISPDDLRAIGINVEDRLKQVQSRTSWTGRAVNSSSPADIGK